MCVIGELFPLGRYKMDLNGLGWTSRWACGVMWCDVVCSPGIYNPVNWSSSSSKTHVWKSIKRYTTFKMIMCCGIRRELHWVTIWRFHGSWILVNRSKKWSKNRRNDLLLWSKNKGSDRLFRLNKVGKDNKKTILLVWNPRNRRLWYHFIIYK